MEFQSIGIVSAAAAFLGIWFGHVAVRVLEYRFEKLWMPIIGALVLGMSMEVWSLITANQLVAAATGILGMTLLWDALEFWRQEKRIAKGHAPANPDNPRHARILEQSRVATRLDLLNRDPVGHPVSPEEALRLVSGSNKA